MNVSNRHFTTALLSVFASKQINKLFWAIYGLLNKGFCLMLLVICLTFSYLQAQQTQQTLTIPTDSTISLNTLLNCENTSSFVSDMDEHHLYTDSTPRSDTMSICPQNQSQRIKVSFLHFDLAAGDTLIAYDGRIPSALNLIDKASGVGNSQAFGSWVASHCSPAYNPTGCISFIFKTNGDRTASAGFKTNRIKNSAGLLCLDTCLSKARNMSLTDTFAFGTYLVEYKLKQDSTIAQQITFTVQPPILACNDTINIAMDASCGVSLDPYLLLETECPANGDTLHYQITVRDAKDSIIMSGIGKNGAHPIITKGMVQYCRNAVYTAEIKRIYYDGLNLSFCNDGIQTNACWTILRFEDKLPPLFIDPIQTDTIYTCDINSIPTVLDMTKPEIFENCETNQVLLKTIETPTPQNICDTAMYYLMVWEASDACGRCIIELRGT